MRNVRAFFRVMESRYKRKPASAKLETVKGLLRVLIGAGCVCFLVGVSIIAWTLAYPPTSSNSQLTLIAFWLIVGGASLVVICVILTQIASCIGKNMHAATSSSQSIHSSTGFHDDEEEASLIPASNRPNQGSAVPSGFSSGLTPDITEVANK